jgi:hypothetical protein
MKAREILDLLKEARGASYSVGSSDIEGFTNAMADTDYEGETDWVYPQGLDDKDKRVDIISDDMLSDPAFKAIVSKYKLKKL